MGRKSLGNECSVKDAVRKAPCACVGKKRNIIKGYLTYAEVRKDLSK